MTLTARQRDVLTHLAVEALAPRQIAERLWPDSPGWQNRTRRYGTNRNGALGGTMPMLAAKILWRLRDDGLVREPESDAYLWRITDRGREALGIADDGRLYVSACGQLAVYPDLGGKRFIVRHLPTGQLVPTSTPSSVDGVLRSYDVGDWRQNGVGPSHGFHRRTPAKKFMERVSASGILRDFPDDNAGRRAAVVALAAYLADA
jgi:hypothetical protein